MRLEKRMHYSVFAVFHFNMLCFSYITVIAYDNCYLGHRGEEGAWGIIIPDEDEIFMVCYDVMPTYLNNMTNYRVEWF